VADSTLTTTATIVDGWTTSAITTQSYTFSVTRTGSPTSTSSSSWTTSIALFTSATSQTTFNETTLPITYSNDSPSFATTTILIGTDTHTIPLTSSNVTEHALSPLQDTVLLHKANRDHTNYHLGNEAWVFSLGGLAATASTVARFTNIYSSVTGPTNTITDFRKFKTFTVAATAVDVSYDTTATTSITQTGPTTTDTATTALTVSTTYKNSVTWNPTATSNTATTTQTFAVGDVSSSSSTYTAGFPVSTFTDTIIYQTAQVTGYATFWTSTTTTAGFPFESSSSNTYLALYSPTTTTVTLSTRGTSTNEILFSSFLTTGTSTKFVGMVRTTTTQTAEVPVTTSSKVWHGDFNPEAENYTTFSTTTVAGGAIGTSYSKGDTVLETYHTEEKLYASIQTYPDNAGFSPFTNHDQIWHSGPAVGFGGFGGEFTQSSMPVYLTLSIGLASGSAFGTQTLASSDLPTALAYDFVTFFPARTNHRITPPSGAVAASYLSRLSSLGETASVAVTWSTSTTTTADGGGTTSAVTTQGATYSMAGFSLITGDFIHSASVQFNTVDVRGGFGKSGGYGAGNNRLGKEYTVRVDGGYAEWTEFGSTGSITTHSSSGTSASLSVTIAGSRAFVMIKEPVYTALWGDNPGGEYFSSIPHFPTT